MFTCQILVSGLFRVLSFFCPPCWNAPSSTSSPVPSCPLPWLCPLRSSSLWGRRSWPDFPPSLLTTTVSGKTWFYCLSNKWNGWWGERELDGGNNAWTVSDWTRWKMACRWPVASPLPPGPLAVRERHGVFSLCVQQSIPDSHCQFLKNWCI